MDRNKAHDVLHIWNGNKTENCPVCCGKMTTDDEIIAAAKDIAADNYYPRVKPGMGDALYCDENGNPIKKEEPKAAEQAPVTAEESGNKAPVVVSENHAPGFMTDILSFSEEGGQGLPKKIKIIPTGTFKTQAYGDVKITKESLLEMADNYKKGVRAGVPIDIDHDQKAAAGWITDVEVQDDGMYAQVEWTKLGEDKLGTKEYRFFSPEFAQSYIDPEHSHELSNVLIAGSLVNRPMFKELPAIAGSEDGAQGNLTKNHAPLMLLISNQSSAEVPTDTQTLLKDSKKDTPMDLQTILAKEKSARTSDEQLFVAANLDKLSDEQKKAEGFVVAASEEKKPEEVVKPEDNNPPKGDETITAAEKANMKVITASEYEVLKAQAEQGTLAFKELKKKEHTDYARSLTFSEQGGRIAPAQVEPIVELLMTMSEPQQATFKKILEAIPEKQIFGENGSELSVEKGQALDQLNALATEKVKAAQATGQVLAFSEALKAVAAENPELYNASLKPARE